ncbi:MAG: formate--tetrahydrofolate ligase [Acidobacteria bacterium]|nr:formate--tetrahydrofolate ligase [Acidobacteriota bacterium]
MLPISDIAAKLDLSEDQLEPVGRHAAKLRLEILDTPPKASGKMVLVTAITPTTAGEGKTVTSIGLTQALCLQGRRAVVALREPSLGPVFGLKGGATGSGRSAVEPHERINLHFTGDFHAVTAAHNLLAALLDAHLHHGNALGIDPTQVVWPRTLDVNDRALRRVVTGLGGRLNGPIRESGVVITAASEVMAILALASGRDDLRRRLGEIVVAYTAKGTPVRASDLTAVGSMMVLMQDALLPNLVQTTEGAPAIIHAGPFANIAHGTSSVLAQRMGLHLADYVINEAGFGADLGAEKFLDIVMPASGHVPAAAVLVATVKGLRVPPAGAPKDTPGSFDVGFANLDKHVANLRTWGVPVVVAVNRFPNDTDDDLATVMAHCEALGVPAAIGDGYFKGGEGMLDLADKVVAAAEASQPEKVKPVYTPDTPLEMKVVTVATVIYGADGVVFRPEARNALKRFTDLGYGHLPVCIAKTQYSLSDNPKLPGAPRGWALTVTEASLSAGAGFVVAVSGDMMLMPGLGKSPQAHRLDLDPDGQIVGMM